MRNNARDAEAVRTTPPCRIAGDEDALGLSMEQVDTIGMTISSVAAPVHLPARTWLSRLRAARGYESAVRVIGGTWFLILAFRSGIRIIPILNSPGIGEFGPAGWPDLLSSLCLFLFYMTLFFLIMHRPLPVARSDGLLPALTAFLGTYFPWMIGLFAPEAPSVSLEIVSASLLLIGAVSMVAVIFHLGHCFSIVPQARKLIRTGPYGVVRHPLYLAEEVALLGMLLQRLSPLTLALFLVHGALQVRRTFYEDSLLRRAFPDFDDYARSTSRLIPYVW